MRTSCLFVTVVLAATAGVAPADWPQFLGPNRNGIADAGETNLARSWPAGGPKVLWTVKIGAGFGGAAIRDGKVYLLDRIGQESDVLRCFDFDSGKELWRFAYPATGRLNRGGSRAVPTVGQKYIFTVGPFGHFHCIDADSHEVVWKMHLIDDFGGKRPRWGVSQSPVLYKNTVIVAPLSGQVGVAAFEKATGKLLWKTPYVGRMEYASPQIVKLDGVDQVLMLANEPRRGSRTPLATNVVGVDANSGKVLWRFNRWKCMIPISNAVPIGGGRFFITGGYRAGSAMFEVRKQGQKWIAQELFQTDIPSAQVHTPLLREGHLYTNSNSNEDHDGMVCMDLEGNIKWQTGQSPNFERGNMILADGLMFNLDGQTGILHLIEPSPVGYKELARARIVGQEKEKYREERIWAPMAICDGRIVLRDQKQMKCIDVRANAGR